MKSFQVASMLLATGSASRLDKTELEDRETKLSQSFATAFNMAPPKLMTTGTLPAAGKNSCPAPGSMLTRAATGGAFLDGCYMNTTRSQDRVESTGEEAQHYLYMWKHACAYTKWVPSNQFMYSNLDYDASTMTLERFGFIGMDRRCFWGSIGVLWKRPLPVEQIIPNTIGAYVPIDTLIDQKVKLSAKISASFEQEHTIVPKKENPMSHLQRFHIGISKSGPSRCMINHPDKDMKHWNNPKSSMADQPDWDHHMTFLAHGEPLEDTHKVAAGWARNPDRALLNHPSAGKDQAYWDRPETTMTTNGWTHYNKFYAHDNQKPGMIRMAVGEQVQAPHRMFINHPDHDQAYWNDPAHKMSLHGFAHYMEFWAYPGNLRITGLDYEMDQAEVLSYSSEEVYTKTLINRSEAHHTTDIEYEYSFVDTSSWSHDMNSGIQDTSGAVAGLPAFADGQFSVTSTTQYNFHEKRTVTRSENRKYFVEVDLAPGTKVDISCSVRRNRIKIPYHVNFDSEWGAPEHALKGLWNGDHHEHAKCNFATTTLY